MNNFNFVIYCTFMCVDVARTASVGLLDTRGFSPVPELSFLPAPYLQGLNQQGALEQQLDPGRKTGIPESEILLYEQGQQTVAIYP